MEAGCFCSHRRGWEPSPGEALGERELCGCGYQVPPRAQREQSSAVGTCMVDVLSAISGWLGKGSFPSPALPGPQYKHLPCPWSETDTWIFQHNLENPGSSNHTPMDQESQSSNGRKRTLNLRIVFALKLKLLSPGSLPPPRLPSFHLLCPKSDLKGQI